MPYNSKCRTCLILCYLAPARTDLFESCNNLQQENSILLPGGTQPYGFHQGRLA